VLIFIFLETFSARVDLGLTMNGNQNFDQEKLQEEVLLRKRELDIRQKEIDLKEKELGRSGWGADKIALITIVGTILAASVAAITQAAVAYYNNSAQLEIENNKAEAARILGAINADKPAQTVKNLQFLVDTELVGGALRGKVRDQLQAMATASERRMAPPFREVRQDIVQVLGNPIRDGVLVDDAYQAVYEHANVIWIKNLLTIFVLPRDQTQSNSSVIRHQEGHFSTDARFFKDEEARKLFNTPEGKLPPHGGLASLWESDPERWKWVGWRVWHCRFSNKIYVQEFENGTAIGPLLVRPDQRLGQVFFIPNGGRWISRMTPSEASACEAVG
jgi:hypothetical protein